MPLRKVPTGASAKLRREIAAENIRREIEAGRPRKQAIAIGLRSAGLSKPKKKKPRR